MSDMDAKESSDIAYMILLYAEQLLDASTPPQIPEGFAEDKKFSDFHAKNLALRDIMASFARGDLSPQINLRGVVAGSCKALQANLRHMAWKVQQVEKGDYTQRVDFMGDFSSAFNSMVVQLDTMIKALKQKEEALTNLAISLQEEARRRSTALEQLKKSEAEYKYLAQHDSLTGALNRRSFFSFSQAKLESSLALDKPCCVCLLDIDHFKYFNDNYGHVEGDRALKYVVEKSLKSLRQTDIMGRYGGEEFIFFFTDVSLEQGKIAAERIREAIDKNCLNLLSGPSVTIQASLGVACILPEWANEQGCNVLLEHAISQADAALYQSKTMGRNIVSVAPLKSFNED